MNNSLQFYELFPQLLLACYEWSPLCSQFDVGIVLTTMELHVIYVMNTGLAGAQLCVG